MIKSLSAALATMLLAGPVAAQIGITVNITTTTSTVDSDRIAEVVVIGEGTYVFPDPHTAPELSQASLAIQTALDELGLPMGTNAVSQGTTPIGSDSTSVQSITSNYNPIDNPDYVVGDPSNPSTWIAVGPEDVNVFVTVTITHWTFHRLTAEIVVACGPGTYSATGNEPCTPCGPGTYELDSGSLACDPCPGGQETPCNGNGVCSDGPTGDGTCTCDVGYTGVACETGPPTTTTTTTSTTSTTTTTLAGPCAAAPQPGCVVAAKAGLQITRKSDPKKNKLTWKLSGGSLAVEYANLGDPATSTSWTLCIYDSTLDTPHLAAFMTVDPSATFWKGKASKGWKYKDKAGSQDGVSGASLAAGVAGKPKAQLKATGTNLSLPAPVSATKLFEQSSTVTVQLVKQGGPGADVCWTSEFDVADTKSNSPEKFKAAAK